MVGETEPRGGSVVGGSAVLFASRVAVSAISYVGTAAVARALSVEDWGAFTFVLSLATLVSFVFDFQVGRLVLKEVLDGNDPGRTVGSFLVLRAVMGCLAYAAAVTFVALGDYERPVVTAMAIGGVSLILAPAWTALNVLFQARLRFRSVAVATLIARIVGVALVLLMLSLGVRSLPALMVPGVVNELLVLVLLFAATTRQVRVRTAIEPARWWAWIKESIPIALGASIGAVYFRVDAVILSAIGTLEAVGYYGAGYKLTDVVAYLPAAIMAPTFTLLVASMPGDAARFRSAFRGAFALMAISALGATVALCVFAEPVLALVFGDRFTAAASAARLVAVGQGLHFFTSLCVYTLIAANRNRTYALTSIVGLACNVALNVVLIPRWSYNGAAAATVITEVAVLAVLARAVSRLPHRLEVPWPILARCALASGALAAAALAVDVVAPWPVAAVAGAAAFLGALHVIGVDGPGGLRVISTLLQAPPTPKLDVNGVESVPLG